MRLFLLVVLPLVRPDAGRIEGPPVTGSAAGDTSGLG
jgi:hypothetical protein